MDHVYLNPILTSLNILKDFNYKVYTSQDPLCVPFIIDIWCDNKIKMELRFFHNYHYGRGMEGRLSSKSLVEFNYNLNHKCFTCILSYHETFRTCVNYTASEISDKIIKHFLNCDVKTMKRLLELKDLLPTVKESTITLLNSVRKSEGSNVL